MGSPGCVLLLLFAALLMRYPPFLYLRVNFPREAESCDASVVSKTPLVPLFEGGNHHPTLPSFSSEEEETEFI